MTRTEPTHGGTDDSPDLPVVPLTSPDATPEQVADLTEIEAAAAERMTFFSDAVVAIAITLLALELPVPGESALATMTNHQLLGYFHIHLDAYIAFIISFWVIAGHWGVHHNLFRYLTRLRGPLLALNMVWLLFIVVTPVATKMLDEGGQGSFRVRFSIYAAVQALQSLLMLAMVGQMRRRSLLRPDTPPRTIQAARGRSLATFIAFAVSIPVAFVLTGRTQNWAYGLWFLVPVVWLAVVRTKDRMRAAGQ